MASSQQLQNILSVLQRQKQNASAAATPTTGRPVGATATTPRLSNLSNLMQSIGLSSSAGARAAKPVSSVLQRNPSAVPPAESQAGETSPSTVPTRLPAGATATPAAAAEVEGAYQPPTASSSHAAAPKPSLSCDVQTSGLPTAASPSDNGGAITPAFQFSRSGHPISTSAPQPVQQSQSQPFHNPAASVMPQDLAATGPPHLESGRAGWAPPPCAMTHTTSGSSTAAAAPSYQRFPLAGPGALSQPGYTDSAVRPANPRAFETSTAQSHTPTEYSGAVPPARPSPPPVAQTPVMPPQESAVLAVGIMDNATDGFGASSRAGNALRGLVGSLGPLVWLKLVTIPPTGREHPSRVLHVCFAQFSDPNVCYAADKQLHGLRVPGAATLNTIVLPTTAVSSVYHDDTQLLTLAIDSGMFSRNAPHSLGLSHPAAVQPPMAALAHTVFSKELAMGSETARSTTTPGAAASHDMPPPVANAVTPQMLMAQGNMAPSAPPSATSPPVASPLSAVPPAQVDPAVPSSVGVAPSSSLVPSRGPPRFQKLLCRLELIDLFSFHPEFDVPARIVGTNNSHIEYVLSEAKHRVDIDLNGIPVDYAPVMERLHLTVTALDQEAYTIAVETLEDLLRSICQQFSDFCAQHGKVMAGPCRPGFRRHEYREGFDGQFIYLRPNTPHSGGTLPFLK